MPTRDDALDARIDAIEDARSQTLTEPECIGKAADEADDVRYWPTPRYWPTS